jgi:hypothetical protein
MDWPYGYIRDVLRQAGFTFFPTDPDASRQKANPEPELKRLAEPLSGEKIEKKAISQNPTHPCRQSNPLICAEALP